MGLSRLHSLRQIHQLRRSGLGVHWNVNLMWDERAVLEFGQRCGLGFGSLLSLTARENEAGTLRMGNDVTFGAYNNIRPNESSILLGDRVLFAQFVSLIARNHLVDENNVVSRTEPARARDGISIGDDCWLGANVVMLPGTSIASRTIVGAGAVVTRRYETPGITLVGNPARPLQRDVTGTIS